jgi:hypothetical protein
MNERRYAYKTVAAKLQGKIPHGILRCTCVNNNKIYMHVREAGSNDLKWVELVNTRNYCVFLGVYIVRLSKKNITEHNASETGSVSVPP